MKLLISKPTLLVDKKKVLKNIQRMAVKADRDEVIFRPHFKTHQSWEIGEMFRKEGVHSITVSSVSMAAHFAANGWNDITIAFPVNLTEASKIGHLTGQVSINLLVDSEYSTLRLDELLKNEVGIFIEIDNGYHRSGLSPDQTDEIDLIIKAINHSSHLHFSGFLTHAGNTYQARGGDEILSIMNDAAVELNSLKAKYIANNPEIITSYGDTPSCSMADNLSAFDEIRPGNFVYYDVMQYHIGSCSLDDIAVAVACPIVSVYPGRNELILYGGAVHLSKEFIEGDHCFKLFGYLVNITDTGWGDPIPGAYVSSISQEHGIVKMPAEYIKNYKPGDVLGVLPIHSCLTADLLLQHSILI
jgi:D-serine deaminase-like pyridoxal phosphate-dependent protein